MTFVTVATTRALRVVARVYSGIREAQLMHDFELVETMSYAERGGMF